MTWIFFFLCGSFSSTRTHDPAPVPLFLVYWKLTQRKQTSESSAFNPLLTLFLIIHINLDTASNRSWWKAMNWWSSGCVVHRLLKWFVTRKLIQHPSIHDSVRSELQLVFQELPLLWCFLQHTKPSSHGVNISPPEEGIFWFYGLLHEIEGEVVFGLLTCLSEEEENTSLSYLGKAAVFVSRGFGQKQ